MERRVKVARSEVTDAEVREFKRKWYLALLTNEVYTMHFDKGRRVEKIGRDTTPESVGIKENAQVDDIVAFKRLIGNVRLFGVVYEKHFVYLDEHAISTLYRFTSAGLNLYPNVEGAIVTKRELVKDIRFIFPPIHDARLSSYSPLIYCEVNIDKEALEIFLSEASTYIESEIGSIEEAYVH